MTYAGCVITRICFEHEAMQRLGLKTEALTNLGPRVVLAGPNGGGKTRYLKLVAETVERYKELREEAAHTDDLRRRIAMDTSLLRRRNLRSKLLPNAKIEEGERALQQIAVDDTTDGKWLHTALISYRPHVIPADPSSLPSREIDQRLTQISSGDYMAVASGLHVFLDRMAHLLWNGTHPQAGAVPAIGENYAVARRFNALLQELLGTTVEPRIARNADVVPYLFDRPFQQDALSVGQRVLLCWAILLFQQAGHYIRTVVMIDEPEVYLHPDACARAIDKLQRLLGKDGQIWIATHSLPLIAWAGVDSLHFVEDGVVSFAGTTPSKVWRTLLGGDAAHEHLLSFLDGDAAAAIARFAAECLPTARPSCAEDRTGRRLTDRRVRSYRRAGTSTTAFPTSIPGPCPRCRRCSSRPACCGGSHRSAAR